jgi:steroid delta-isomerase
MSEGTPDIVRRYYRALETRDERAFLSCFAREGTLEDPVGTTPLAGEVALGAFFGGLTSGFATLSVEAVECFTSGHGIAVKFAGRVTTPDGRRGEAEGIDVFHVDAAGLIRELRGYWDPAGLMARLK